MRSDREWLDQAVELAMSSVNEGGGPFGALIVREGELVSLGQNRVTRDLDPTAHAEVQAIRTACNVVGDFALTGMTLYTSCEPCPLCCSAALWARLDRVVYAADRYDAARGGFDDLAFYELFAQDRDTWSMPVQEIAVEAPAAPFDAWLAQADRVDY